MNYCDPDNGYKAFSAQVHCLDRIAGHETDQTTGAADSDAKLLVLSADDLLARVNSKRLSPTAARLKLREAYMDIRLRQQMAYEEWKRTRAIVATEQTATIQAQRQQREQAEKVELNRQEAARRLELARRAAVHYCVDQTEGRMEANYQRVMTDPHSSGTVRNNAGMIRGFQTMAGDKAIWASCQANPRYYESVVVQQTPTTIVVNQDQDIPLIKNTYCDPPDSLGAVHCSSM